MKVNYIVRTIFTDKRYDNLTGYLQLVFSQPIIAYDRFETKLEAEEFIKRVSNDSHYIEIGKIVEVKL